MHYRKLFTLIFSIAYFGSAAQTSDSVRDRNVEKFHDYFFCWPVIKQRSTSFEFRNLANSTRVVRFKPNNSYHAGFGMYLFEVGFEITFAMPMDRQRKFLYGESGAQDLQANVLGKNWGADLFISDYQGFYAEDSANPLAANQPFPQRPDIRTHNLGANGIYIFNQNKFSIRSAYNFADRQLKSGGSFLLSSTLNTYRVSADSAVLSKKYETIFGSFSNFHALHSTTFSVAPGYTYSLIIKNFFINASLAVGPAQHWTNYTLTNNQVSHRTSLDSFADFRIAIGYNGERFFAGMSFVDQSRNIKFENTRFTSSSTTFKMVIGYRFREFGILKKRALDLLPKFGHS